MRPPGRALLALAAMLAMVAGVQADSLTYRNDRFGTSATFPAALFRRAMEPPANGDGMTFLSEDGARLAVFGQYNALDMTPETLADHLADPQARPGIVVTYRQTGPDWLVLSGREGREIFYQRHRFGADGVIHAVVITYFEESRSIYDELVGQIAASLGGP